MPRPTNYIASVMVSAECSMGHEQDCKTMLDLQNRVSGSYAMQCKPARLSSSRTVAAIKASCRQIEAGEGRHDRASAAVYVRGMRCIAGGHPQYKTRHRHAG
jgi:hypothetical protein